VLSLRGLLIADPETLVAQIMTRDVVGIRADESDEAAVAALMKYDLLAVPVLDADHRLLGIVTVDDLMDLMVERVGGRTPRRLDRIRRVAKE
jgi:magnesium transporter